MTVTADHLEPFDRVTLSDLNLRAGLLDREERKYLLSSAEFELLVESLAERFDVLEIDGERLFTYETTYFDTDELLMYHQHLQNKRRRIKIRSRRYVDSGQCYFEVKSKGVRGRTIKNRMDYGSERHGHIEGDAIDFVTATVGDSHGEALSGDLIEALTMQYRRLTLVAKDRPERLTIDSALTFTRPDGVEAAAPDDTIIVEVKSPGRSGLADEVLAGHRHRPTSCSKYCVGLNLLNAGLRNNRFQPVLKKHFDWSGPEPISDDSARPGGQSTHDQPAAPDEDDHDEQLLRRVSDLLATEFADVDAERIAEIVGDAQSRFVDASIRTYLPVLVHRDARTRLIAAGEPARYAAEET